MVTLPPTLQKSYPFQNHFFSLGENSRLHYLDEGPRASKAVVLLHGNPTWSFYYRHLVKDLVTKGHRVIAPDHLGCGLSSKNESDSYNLSGHIKNLTQLLKHLELEKVTLVVHDWGGAIGFGWATENPDKLEKIVITNTAAYLSKHIPWRIALCKAPLLNSFLIRRLNGFAYPALTMGTAKGLSKEAREGLLFPYDSYENRVAIANFVEDIPLQEKHPSYNTLLSIEEKLPLIRVPKLLLWGMKDFCFNSHFLKRWKEIYPETRVVEYENSGHYLFEDEKELVNQEILNFLELEQNHECHLTH